MKGTRNGAIQPRHKQDPIGIFGKARLWNHGTTHSYQVHRCRCEACKAAMSAYGKARYIQSLEKPVVVPSRSWWLDGDFSNRAKQELPRMRESRFGGAAKSYATEELHR